MILKTSWLYFYLTFPLIGLIAKEDWLQSNEYFINKPYLVHKDLYLYL